MMKTVGAHGNWPLGPLRFVAAGWYRFGNAGEFSRHPHFLVDLGVYPRMNYENHPYRYQGHLVGMLLVKFEGVREGICQMLTRCLPVETDDRAD